MAGKLMASVPHVRGPRSEAGVSGEGGLRLRAPPDEDAAVDERDESDESGSGVGTGRGL